MSRRSCLAPASGSSTASSRSGLSPSRSCIRRWPHTSATAGRDEPLTGAVTGRTAGWRTAVLRSPRRRDEHGNLALGAFLVLGVRREGRDRAFPPLGPLVSRDLADARVEGPRAVLNRSRPASGLEVGVPDGVPWQTALRRDERVLAGVLDAHERRLAQLA